MTISVELDADPPVLRRSDGLVVRFPGNENGGFDLIEAGWEAADGFEAAMLWKGLAYQELHPGKDAALLVGHLSGGGYCSAAVQMDAQKVTIEFAEKAKSDSVARQSRMVWKPGTRIG